MKYQNFSDDNAANRKFYLTGFAANRKFYLRAYASNRKFYKTRSTFKRKFSFCLKKEKRRKPKQETVGAIVATHPPASCPPLRQKASSQGIPRFWEDARMRRFYAPLAQFYAQSVFRHGQALK